MDCDDQADDELTEASNVVPLRRTPDALSVEELRAELALVPDIHRRLDEFATRLDLAERVEEIEARLRRYRKQLRRHRRHLQRYDNSELTEVRREAREARAYARQAHELATAVRTEVVSATWSWWKIAAGIAAMAVVAWALYKLATALLRELKRIQELPSYVDQREIYVDQRRFESYDQRRFDTYDQRTIHRPVVERERIRVERVAERTVVERQPIVQPTEVHHDVRVVSRVVERQPIIERKTVYRPTVHTREVVTRSEPTPTLKRRPSSAKKRSRKVDAALAAMRRLR